MADRSREGRSSRGTTRASGRVVGLVLLLAVSSLVLGVPAGAAQPDPPVGCDPAYYDREVGMFMALPGVSQRCAAYGAAPEVEARWEVSFFSLETGQVLGEPVSGTLLPGGQGFPQGQFEFVVPDDLLWYEGIVLQGPDDAPSYRAEFSGTTDWVSDGEMSCQPAGRSGPDGTYFPRGPEPVARGGTLECIVWGLLDTHGYTWQVVFETEGKERLAEIDGRNGIRGGWSERGPVGRGMGEMESIFSVTVPNDDRIVSYLAVAEQPRFEARFEGTVVAAAAQPEPEPRPEPSEPSPVVVQQPTRIDTGGGGTAPSGPDATALAAFLGVGLGVSLLLRRARRTVP
jgi:hypothetical protein